MKKTILITLLFCVQLLSAQERKSNGFIALTVGPSFPMGQQSGSASFSESGAHINLVNFAPRWGILVGLDYFNTKTKILDGQNRSL